MPQINFKKISTAAPPYSTPIIVKGWETYLEKEEGDPPIIAVYELKKFKRYDGSEFESWTTVGVDGIDWEPALRHIEEWAEIPEELYK